MNRREILKSGAAGSLGLVAAAALLPDAVVPPAEAQTASAPNAPSAAPGGFRTEADSLGEVQVAADKLWGAQTQRSLEHFSIGSDLMPREMIASYATLKKAAANANHDAKRLDDQRFRQGWRQAARLESARVRNGIFHAVCMMESAICAALAKRERRREAGTIWL